MNSDNPNSIKVAIAGVGNLASGLVQSIEYYKGRPGHRTILHPSIGGFTINDIKVVAAFDIDERKVGRDLSEAIFADPNKTPKVIDVPFMDVKVMKAPVMDGIAETAENVLIPSKEKESDVVKVVKDSRAEVLIIALPSGAIEAAEFFAQVALDAGVALINTTPTPIARASKWTRSFKEKNLPVLGDDLQSQAGGTAFHKGLIRLLNSIGVMVDDTYQLDVSGGLEGLTTLDYDRRLFKRHVKEESISRALNHEFNIASGTTDYLDFLGSLRIGNYWVKGEGFLGQEVTMDIRMESIDGSNGAAALVDAIRCAKLAINQVQGGPIVEVGSYLFKAPSVFLKYDEAEKSFLHYISGVRID